MISAQKKLRLKITHKNPLAEKLKAKKANSLMKARVKSRLQTLSK